MTRTSLYKAYYFGVIAIFAAVEIAVLTFFDLPPLYFIIAVLVMLIPGRVLGYYWRDLLRGLRLLNAKQFAESKRHSERFLSYMETRAWLKHLVWLGSSAYSRDPRVLALNNIGAAEIGLGRLDSAKSFLDEAIALDGECPLPFYNLGGLYAALDDPEESARCYQQARRLGYTRGLSDKIVIASQTRFAARDGSDAS